MDKNTSISLHLAKVMGLEGAHLHTYPVVFEGTAKQDVFISEEMGKKRFDPFTNRAQWADVVLWFANKRHTLILQSDLVMADFADIHANPAENTEGSIIDATLECVALATGWAG